MGLIREIPPAFLSVISGPFNPAVSLHVDWPDEPVRVHAGVGTMVWGGYSWQGVGAMGGLTLPDESDGLASFSGEMRLGGNPAEIAALLGVDASGRDVDVWFGATTTRAGNVLVSDPVLIFSGFVDGLEYDQDEESAYIIAGLSSGPSQRASAAVYHTYEDQIAAHPGDTMGRWVKADVSRTVVELPKW